MPKRKTPKITRRVTISKVESVRAEYTRVQHFSRNKENNRWEFAAYDPSVKQKVMFFFNIIRGKNDVIIKGKRNRAFDLPPRKRKKAVTLQALNIRVKRKIAKDIKRKDSTTTKIIKKNGKVILEVESGGLTGDDRKRFLASENRKAVKLRKERPQPKIFKPESKPKPTINTKPKPSKSHAQKLAELQRLADELGFNLNKK